MGELSHREDLVMKMTEDEKADMKAAVDGVAHAFNDGVMLEQKSFDDSIKIMQARDMHDERRVKYQEELEKYYAINRLFQDPDFVERLNRGDPSAVAELRGQVAQTEAGQRQQLKQMQANTVWKQKDIASVAMRDIESQFTPEIYHSVPAQIALIDSFAYMETGSTRPSVAQYKTIMDKMGVTDKMLVALNLGKAVLGPDQINKIMRTARA